MAELEKAKLELKQHKFEAKQAFQAKELEEKTAIKNREIDVQYLEFTVVLVLLVLIIYFLTNRFGFGWGNKPEQFSPYASILTPDIGRSDASFDYAQNMPYKSPDWQSISNLDFNANAQLYASEDRLFQQTHDLRM
jgi:hypothetical protein